MSMNTGVSIRLARAEQAPEIARLSRDLVEHGLGWSWTPARVMRQIRHPESVVLTAVAGERIAGFAIMRFGDEEAYLNLLAVRGRFQRTGIGRRLVEWLEASARTAGITTVYLEVRVKNLGARTFYRKLAYREVAYLRGYYEWRESALRMMRDLAWETSPNPP